MDTARLFLLIKKVLYWWPLAFISLVVGSLPYIALSTIGQIISQQQFLSLELYAVCVALTFWALAPLARQVWKLPDLQWRPSNLYLLGLAAIIIGYRSVIYFHAIDDFVFHITSGYYASTMWIGDNFLPMDFPTYLFPMLQNMYFFFIQAVGIRFTLLFLSVSQLVWFFHLNARFATHIFPLEKDRNRRWIIDFFFLFLFFLPELVLSHVTFMSDLYAVLFALEVFYAYLKRSSLSWMTVLMMVAIFTKQSSGLFLVPLFAFFFLTRIRTLRWSDLPITIVYGSSILIFHFVTWMHTGNPLSFLMNSTFGSPLYSDVDFRDYRWGPLGLRAVLTWPLYGALTSRYVEFAAQMKIRPFFSIFLSLPYIVSFFMMIKTRRPLIAMGFLSYLFWSWQSGYARYQIAMGAIIWLALLFEFKNWVPKVKVSLWSLAAGALIALVCFTSMRNDYALRGFFLEKFLPPKLSAYHFQLYKDGLQFFGRDRYIDVYNSVKPFYEGYDGIVIADRGIATYYAFIAHYGQNMPVVSALQPEEEEKIRQSTVIDSNILESIDQTSFSERTLLVVDDGYVHVATSSTFFTSHRCERLVRKKTAPQFQHDNFFNHVQEFTCL